MSLNFLNLTQIYINNPVICYSFMLTTYNIIKWKRIARPTITNLAISYLISLSSRIIFYPLYIMYDGLHLISVLSENLSRNNIVMV